MTSPEPARTEPAGAEPTGPVIVGVDGGASGTDALLLGRWAADVLQVPLLVAVVHPAPAGGAGRIDAEWIADRHRAASAVLDGARAVLKDLPGPVDYRTVASTSASHGLHDLAEELDAQAIVVGSGKSAPPARLFAGSTAERLLAGAGCAIVVAPAGLTTPPGSLDRIGVAFIDTPDGHSALQTAAAIAEATRSPLRLYTVVTDNDTTLPPLIGQDTERAFQSLAREGYEAALAAAIASVPDVDADYRILVGNVVDVLAEVDDVDVLFCGSRGYGPARRVLLGGVSTKLLRRARRPIAVVPRIG
jgi:nucleotide-binding universal stress UspA family protein